MAARAIIRGIRDVYCLAMAAGMVNRAMTKITNRTVDKSFEIYLVVNVSLNV